MSKFGMSLFAGVMMMGAMACNNGVADTSQNAVICQRACKKTDACTGNNDESDCREKCVDKSHDSNTFENDAKKCNECLDKDDSCVDKALKCGTECASIIAVSAST
ncbi:MAG: hypothetical protein JWN04_6727 [Myxococcaceae bacterium]|nr:hypothetical protein [Myxococcaceae bacterium]